MARQRPPLPQRKGHGLLNPPAPTVLEPKKASTDKTPRKEIAARASWVIQSRSTGLWDKRAGNSRFADADLGSAVNHHARSRTGPQHQASQTHSLTQGTGAWSALLGRDEQIGVRRYGAPETLAVDTGNEGPAVTTP